MSSSAEDDCSSVESMSSVMLLVFMENVSALRNAIAVQWFGVFMCTLSQV